jgi:hypothetical protein
MAHFLDFSLYQYLSVILLVGRHRKHCSENKVADLTGLDRPMCLSVELP